MEANFAAPTPSHRSSAQPLQQGIIGGGSRHTQTSQHVAAQPVLLRQANTTVTLMAPSVWSRSGTAFGRHTLQNATNSTGQSSDGQRALSFIGPSVGGHPLQSGLSFIGSSAPLYETRIHPPSIVVAPNVRAMRSEMVPSSRPSIPPRAAPPRLRVTVPERYAHLFSDADLDMLSHAFSELELEFGGLLDHDLMGSGARFKVPPIQGKQLEDATRRRAATVADTEECCVVCQMNFAVGDELRVLPCGHTYHLACVDQWFARSAQCPVCKAVVRPNSKEISSKRTCRRQRRSCC